MGQDCPPHGTPEPSPVEHETQKQLATDTSASETRRIRFYYRGTLGVNVEGVVAAGQNDYVEDVVDNSSTEIALNILLEDSRLNMEAIDPPWPSHSNSIHIDGQTQRHIKLGRLCQLVCSFVTHMFDKWGINVPPNLFVTEMIKKETQGWSVLLQRR